MKNLVKCCFILVLLSSCKQRLGNYYFQFDEVIHYSIDRNIHIEKDLLVSENLKGDEKLFQDIIYFDYPNEINNENFEKELLRIGFKEKKVLDNEKLKMIREIFREKSHRDPLFSNCIEEFNDVIVFKNKGQNSGLAKICFSCRGKYILGTKENTSLFGQTGDFSKLYELLYK